MTAGTTRAALRAAGRAALEAALRRPRIAAPATVVAQVVLDAGVAADDGRTRTLYRWHLPLPAGAGAPDAPTDRGPADSPVAPAGQEPADTGRRLIRAYRAGEDDAEVLRINQVAFGSWHPEQRRWGRADLRAAVAAAAFTPQDLLVLPAGDALAGFILTRLIADGARTVGLVEVIATDPAAAPSGAGRDLLAAAAAQLAARGLPRLVWYCEADNVAMVVTSARIGAVVARVERRAGEAPLGPVAAGT